MTRYTSSRIDRTPASQNRMVMGPLRASQPVEEMDHGDRDREQRRDQDEVERVEHSVTLHASYRAQGQGGVNATSRTHTERVARSVAPESNSDDAVCGQIGSCETRGGRKYQAMELSCDRARPRQPA